MHETVADVGSGTSFRLRSHSRGCVLPNLANLPILGTRLYAGQSLPASRSLWSPPTILPWPGSMQPGGDLSRARVLYECVTNNEDVIPTPLYHRGPPCPTGPSCRGLSGAGVVDWKVYKHPSPGPSGYGLSLHPALSSAPRQPNPVRSRPSFIACPVPGQPTRRSNTTCKPSLYATAIVGTRAAETP
jgi:hypothetical protein